MFRKNKMIGTILLIGMFLPRILRGELGGELVESRFIVFDNKGFDKLSFSIFGLQTGRQELSNNKLPISKKNYQGYYNAGTDWDVKEEPNMKTYTLEFLGAIIGGIVGAVPPGVIQIAFSSALSDSVFPEDLVAWLSTLYGATVGGLAGVSWGVTLTGERLDQEGSFWRTLVGSVVLPCVLGLASIPLSNFVSRKYSSSTEYLHLMEYLPLIGIPLGAVIGYNF
jgi:hypothetical protein